MDFDSLDQKPVDLLFVLVVPTENKEEYLGVLRDMAFYLGDPGVNKLLRQCTDTYSVYHALTTEPVSG